MTMKQSITKEQWDELSVERKRWFTDTVKELNPDCKTLPTVGQMIEFLGDDLDSLMRIQDKYASDYKDWMLSLKDGFSNNISSNELIDVLWEAVKYKLKQH